MAARERSFWGFAVPAVLGAVMAFGYWAVVKIWPVGIVDGLWGIRSPVEVRDSDWTCDAWQDYVSRPEIFWPMGPHAEQRRCRFSRLLHDYDLIQVRFENASKQTELWHGDFNAQLNNRRAWSAAIGLAVLWCLICYLCRFL
jgi:hypothetical protein